MPSDEERLIELMHEMIIVVGRILDAMARPTPKKLKTLLWNAYDTCREQRRTERQEQTQRPTPITEYGLKND